MLSNLPPGCTNAMIEAQVGSDRQLCDWFVEQAEKAVRDWDGQSTPDLIADILEATSEDFEEVLAKARGELELRKQKRRKAEK